MKWMNNPALIPGLLYFLFNATSSYAFFHVNSYKMVVLSVFVLGFFFLDDVFRNREKNRIPAWKVSLVLFVPTILSLPGYFIMGGDFNYNFDYELSIDIMMVLWSVYLFRRLESEKEIKIMIYLLGFTFVYAMIWSLLERNSLWMFEGQKIAGGRVKGPFGNINYFSAAITVLFPIFFILGLSSLKFQNKKIHFSKDSYFYFLFATSFLVCIYLTSTRSAQAALILGSFIGAIIFFLGEYPQKKKLIYISILAFILLGVSSILAIKILEPPAIINSRYGELLSLAGWINRFKAWEAAVNSIIASPIIGWGLGSSYSLYFQFVNPNSLLFSHERSFNHVHSEYLETAQEAGILGAILIYGVIFWML